jgi:hypothetical protein
MLIGIKTDCEPCRHLIEGLARECISITVLGEGVKIRDKIDAIV